MPRRNRRARATGGVEGPGAAARPPAGIGATVTLVPDGIPGEIGRGARLAAAEAAGVRAGATLSVNLGLRMG
jgi:hypothetical protein